MRFQLFILIILTCLSPGRMLGDDKFLFDDIPWNTVEIPFYTFAEFTPQVALRMEYAKFEVQNVGDWLEISDRNVAYEIDLVFTKYPENIKDWRTNYYQLLNDRMITLFKIDSTLRSSKIRWNMILQTQCQTEEEAKKFFHGFVIKYRPKKLKVVYDIKTPSELKELITGNVTVDDSTVFKVMDRHPEWDSMLVVMDWTGSMYKFGAQFVLWHKAISISDPEKVKHFVFFNDGNGKKNWQKKIGRTGGVYRTQSLDLDEIVETMEQVMKKGNGGDSPENDIEALLTSVQNLSAYKDVILIADNKSDVRDLELIKHVNYPVRVILCDLKGRKIHPAYVKIARETGGSLHTMHKDYSLERLQNQ